MKNCENEYVLIYTDTEEKDVWYVFDSKEQALEYAENNVDDINFNFDVRVFQVAKTFYVEKATKFKLVEE